MTAAPSEGQVIAERYELQALIGEGGMAQVWRAQDLTLARGVAVKFLYLREHRDRRTMIDRFLREARIAAAVRHANVVDILDFGTTSDGRPFMVMELLEGEVLEDRLGRQPALGLEELVRVAAAVLEGLAAVHRAGVIHRDLKPGNVFLLAEDGDVRPKLLDFGVSRDTDADSGRRSALTTSDGHLVGTPEYMSPEQARGLRDLDWRTDIYSMGVLLYEALTGRLPYECEAVGDLIIQIASGGAPEVAEVRPDIGAPISEVVARAMSLRREDRFQSAREMREALLAAADACPDDDAVVVPLRRLAEPARRAPSPPTAPTLDGPELPWGPTAVPERTSPPPAQWSVDTTLPETRSRLPWLLAAMAIPLAGFGTWYALRSPAAPPGPRAIEAPRVVVSAEEPTPPIASPVEPAPAIEPPALEPVTVRLRGLPRRAEVRVDERTIEPEDGAISLPRDGEAHTIAVLAPGYRPWTATHEADEDGEYRVRLRPPRRERSGSASRSESESESQSGSASESGSESAARPPGGVFRELDY